MTTFSIGLDYAWQTAANEAAHTQHEFIEPEHLFIGVCKLGNLLSLNDWNDIEIPRDAAAALKAEAEAVAAIFQKVGHGIGDTQRKAHCRRRKTSLARGLLWGSRSKLYWAHITRSRCISSGTALARR